MSLAGVKNYLLRVAVAIDQLGNTCMDGDPDETISSRVGKAALAGKRWALIVQPVIDWIFEQLGQAPRHCWRSIEWDEA